MSLLATFGDADYKAFSHKVQSTLGIRLVDYKSDQMKRRLEILAQKHKCNTLMQFAYLMESDKVALGAFLDHMTINVTELFRNPELFKTLQNDFLPGLIQNCGPRPFSMWSAGCSYGAEAYTMAVILSEAISSGNWRVKGTDIDLTILAKANSASFNKMDMTNVTPERKAKNFTTFDDLTYMPSGLLKRNVTFGPHDLLADPYPNQQYDLILCRNVVIYFTDEAKDRIFRGFFQALKPGGMLFVGGTERLQDHTGIGFLTSRPFFYFKPEEQGYRRAA